MRATVASALALAGLASSQRVQVDVTLDGDSNNLEYSKTQSFKCTWEMSQKLLDSGVGLDEPLQIRWYYQGNMIYTLQADEYVPYPSFETEFYDRTDIEASVNTTEKFSTLKVGNVQLSDAGDYKCRVSLAEPREFGTGRKGFASGNANKANVKVYATPNVTFEELNLSHDLRQVQFNKWQTVQDAAAAAAAEEAAKTDEEEGSAQKSDDTAMVDDRSDQAAAATVVAETNEVAATEATRKRRQVETAEVPEIQTIAQTLQLSLGVCKISGAYPQPADVSLFVGGDLLEKNQDLTPAVREDQLFDTSINVGATLVGAMNGEPLKCVASDAEKMYETEAISQDVLDIKYLPQTVSLEMPEIVYDQDADVTVSCKSDGNPAPVLALKSADESVQQAIGNGSSYTIPKISKDQTYTFWCVASTSNQEGFEAYSIQSEQESMEVNFLGKPTIDVDGERSEISDNNFSIAKGTGFSISCEAEAKPEATYKWFKKEGDSEAKEIGESNTYKVEQSDWKDSGVFHCLASNGGKLTQKSEPVTISVQGECEITGTQIVKGKKDDATGAQDIEITCLVSEEVKPVCEVSWIKNSAFDAVYKGEVLILKGVNMMDEDALIKARLTCKASNSFSSYSPTKVVNGSEVAMKVTMEDSNTMMFVIIAVILVVLVGFVWFLKNRKSSGTPEHAPTQGKTENA